MPVLTQPKVAHLVLGTVQLGQPYGVANLTGMPTEHEAVDLLRTAMRTGIRTLDTARAYGTSEHRIGLALADASLPPVTIVTKLDPLAHLAPDSSPAIARRAAQESLASSRRALGRERLDVVLLHRAAHRVMWSGAVWRTLLGERQAGGIERLGVSVASPEEARAAIADCEVEHLQLPFNLLDYRWQQGGVLQALHERPDVTTHVRSVLLQGLLAGIPGTKWPKLPGVDPHDVLGRLSNIARSLGRSGLVDLCIAFVRAKDWIDGIVIGVETGAQLAGILASFERLPLAPHQADFVTRELPRYPESLLTPSRWSGRRLPHTSRGRNR
jgi:aryl-alcohol dehydrogenase-like predicted oxidoreductase